MTISQIYTLYLQTPIEYLYLHLNKKILSSELIRTSQNKSVEQVTTHFDIHTTMEQMLGELIPSQF